MYLINKWLSAFTALLYVTSAVKTAMNKNQGTILLLVDFSSVFDTINHNILIRQLRLRYGFVGKALDWVISYLKERTQRVVIGDQSSSTTTLTRGVPQGSVLGPLHLSLYVQPIGDIIRAHGLFFHQYTEDLQVYAHFDLKHSALMAAVKQMEDCLDEVKVWMTRNSMFTNDGKTQYLPIVPKSADAIIDKKVIRVGVATITASLCVQYLGVCIDRHLNMKTQVLQTISACSFYLRNINQISQRLDYCNALIIVLYGTSAVNIARLQRNHNKAARLIMRSPRSDSATHLLRELHWLLIVCRFDFKLLVHTKPHTTTRQCICGNSCARINQQEHRALRTITC